MAGVCEVENRNYCKREHYDRKAVCAYDLSPKTCGIVVCQSHPISSSNIPPQRIIEPDNSW